MRDLRWQVPGGRRGVPKHSFGTAARGGLKQSFRAASEAVANPLLYQTREGLGGWREHRERRVCTDKARSGFVGTHVGAMRSSDVDGARYHTYPGACSGENSGSRMNGGQEAITLAAAVVEADGQE